MQPEDFRRALERVYELGSGGAYLYKFNPQWGVLLSQLWAK
ncbi:MAG TPA: hypothetical protein VFR43_06440 [Gaiellaceae bacterium]|nr:hypothetical protein [Gaiellaceae bacterium]